MGIDLLDLLAESHCAVRDPSLSHQKNQYYICSGLITTSSHIARTRDGCAFLNAFAFRVAAFLDFAFASPHSFIQFFSPNSKVRALAFQILLCVPVSHSSVENVFMFLNFVCVPKN